MSCRNMYHRQCVRQGFYVEIRAGMSAAPRHLVQTSAAEMTWRQGGNVAVIVDIPFKTPRIAM